MRKRLNIPRATTAIIFLILMYGGVGLFNPSFLEINNILLSLNSGVVYTVVAIGIAFVIITGEIDVSVGAILGLTSTISGIMVRDGHTALAFIAPLIVGTLIGVVNGFGVNYLQIPSIIMTLGTNGIVRGLIYVYTEGKWVENLPFAFKQLCQIKFLDTFTFFYLFALFLMLLICILMAKTRRGQYFRAVGDNPDGANLLGIPVKGTKMVAFILSGLFSSIGGIMYASRVGFI
ncbi:MAG: ABC transporter permease, partial [Sphaerochaetaceae bacterium]